MKTRSTITQALVILAWLATITIFSACGGEHIVRELTHQEQALVQRSNGFGFSLFQEVCSASSGENSFISPLSISMALGMTRNGAAGETMSAMEETLGHSGLTEEEINQGYQGLAEVLKSMDPKVKLRIANSIWYREGFTVLDDFIDTNRNYFDAQVAALDFDSPQAADTINAWVDDKTGGAIDSIIEPPIDAGVMMYLINAIYFKGSWTYKFDEADTQQEIFTTAGGVEKEVPMMSIDADLDYHTTADFQAVRIPYGDGHFMMTILLPRTGVELSALHAQLSKESWDAWQGAMETTTVSLKMPRYELEYETSLNQVLSALGMEVAFSESQADFSRITGQPELFISDVKHKTFLSVDEEGTEAAAVTAVEMTLTSVGPDSLSMVVNRPFVLAIHDLHTGAMLFMGNVLDP